MTNGKAVWTDETSRIVVDDRFQAVSRCDEFRRVGQEDQGDVQGGQAVGKEG